MINQSLHIYIYVNRYYLSMIICSRLVVGLGWGGGRMMNEWISVYYPTTILYNFQITLFPQTGNPVGL